MGYCPRGHQRVRHNIATKQQTNKSSEKKSVFVLCCLSGEFRSILYCRIAGHSPQHQLLDPVVSSVWTMNSHLPQELLSALGFVIRSPGSCYRLNSVSWVHMLKLQPLVWIHLKIGTLWTELNEVIRWEWGPISDRIGVLIKRRQESRALSLSARTCRKERLCVEIARRLFFPTRQNENSHQEPNWLAS